MIIIIKQHKQKPITDSRIANTMIAKDHKNKINTKNYIFLKLLLLFFKINKQ